MSVDGNVHHVPVLKTPCRALNGDLLIDQCLHIGILCAEITGVAEKAVVGHVDDEGTDFSVAESAVTGETNFPRFNTQGFRRCNFGMQISHHPELRDPAIHRVLNPIIVGENGPPVAAPVGVPRIVDDESLASVSNDSERVSPIAWQRLLVRNDPNFAL